MRPAGASSGDNVTFIPAWIHRRLSPVWLSMGWMVWIVVQTMCMLLMLAGSSGLIPKTLGLWAMCIYVTVLLCAVLSAYLLAVRFALLHPSTRHSRGIHLCIVGSVLALCWAAGALLSLFIPALSAIRFVVGTAALILAGLLCAIGFFLWLVEALDRICA